MTDRPTEQEYMDSTKRCAELVLDEIMRKFDFDKAAAALAGCDWRFVDAPSSPTSNDLRKTAEEIVKQLIDMAPGSWIGSGPLQARSRHHGDRAVVSIELILTPVWSSSVFVDGRVLHERTLKREDREAKQKADADQRQPELIAQQ